MGAPHIEKMSVYNTPRVRPAGTPLLPVSRGRLLANVISWQGRSFDCDPRQLAFSFSHGNEPHMQVTSLGKPEMFWQSIGSPRTNPGWVLGRFPGKPGAPTGPVQWTALADKQVPSKAEGVLADLSSKLGAERGMENIIACRGEGRDVVVTHISEGSDRRFIEINSDGWAKDHPERLALVAALDKIQLIDVEKTELSADGKTLFLYSSIKDQAGNSFIHKVDVSCLELNPKDIYSQPEDDKFSLKVLVQDERVDFECLRRILVTTFNTEWTEHCDEAIVRVWQNNNGDICVKVEPKDGSLQTELKAKSLGKLKRDPKFQKQSEEIRSFIIKAAQKTYELDNLNWRRVEKVRPRYVLQFFEPRETRFKKVLAAPLANDESVVITKVYSAGKVVHLNGHNGKIKGTRETVPFNFDPTGGHPENFKLIRLDPRPYAQHSTRFVAPVAYALAGQHLIDPYVMGTDIMAAVWPKIDQLGFFGVNMLTAMAFPHGNVFNPFEFNPWFLRSFGAMSHSIFDSKGDAGKAYHWLTGNPVLAGSKELVGAAMVTGPNTDAVNPVRDGHLFYVRMPGRLPHQVKSAMPGFYLSVVEDAQASYMDMTMFGLKTETTIHAFSAGGGLDNYQLCWTVQRSQRWNAGKSLFLWDGASEMWTDLTRGSSLYHGWYNLTRGSNIYLAQRADLVTSPRRDALAPAAPTAAQKAIRTRALNPKHPVVPKFKFNEGREWVNVGTWYWVSFQKIALYLSVPITIALAVLPIPVAGSMFLVACLACTFFAWPFWAIQMMKVGVNPKGIISLTPIHNFWNDMPMRTMFKCGLDIERLAVGKFRVSDRTMGNRLPTKDKRIAFWLAAVLPTVAGSALLASGAIITMAAGFWPLVIPAIPFVISYFISSGASKLVNRLLPNPGTRSFWRSLARWAAGSIPLGLGLAVSGFAFGTMSVFAIPLAAMMMGGGWALFNGVNIWKCFNRYFKEQREVYALAAPSPNPANIPKHKADTLRHTLAEARGKVLPIYAAEEFTVANISDLALWTEINNAAPGLLNQPKDPITNLNCLVEGEGNRPIDLTIELAHLRPTFFGAITRLGRWYDPVNLLDVISRRLQINSLAKKTSDARQKMASLPKQNRASNTLEPETYDHWCELNRLIIEETFAGLSPQKDI